MRGGDTLAEIVRRTDPAAMMAAVGATPAAIAAACAADQD
jgi:hypothetical protein